ncbi:hypothetical protein QF026_005225 [Streptomyces aurantiacus]|nr:hypothetical protein [Streptomyces aurantiacus]
MRSKGLSLIFPMSLISPISPMASVGLAFVVLLTLSGCGQGGGLDIGRALPSFSNPTVPGLWTPERMADALVADVPVTDDLGENTGVTDPEPAPVPAEAEQTPYRVSAPVLGKLYFDTPAGASVCSATAVQDTGRPGRSDLVWTAGHCVHAGKGGDWYRNVVFVPSYNNEGQPPAAESTNSGTSRIAPLGVWWADRAAVAPEWIAQGGPTGGAGATHDFAVLHMRAQTGATASLEETIGQAAPVWFDAPVATRLPAVKAWGYPAAAPFDGERLFSCQDRPGRLSLRKDRPELYRIGCTMTGGSSGGGWFAKNPAGRLALVSNTSIGPAGNTWLAGPRLGAGARAAYDEASQGATPPDAP